MCAKAIAFGRDGAKTVHERRISAPGRAPNGPEFGENYPPVKYPMTEPLGGGWHCARSSRRRWSRTVRGAAWRPTLPMAEGRAADIVADRPCFSARSLANLLIWQEFYQATAKKLWWYSKRTGPLAVARLSGVRWCSASAKSALEASVREPAGYAPRDSVAGAEWDKHKLDTTSGRRSY